MGGLADLGGGMGAGIGGLMGYQASQGDRDEANRLLRKGAGQMESLDPRVQAQREAIERLGPSAFSSIGPQKTREDQLAALEQLRSIYSQGGLDAQGRAAQYEANQSAAQQARAMNAQVQQSAAMRGLGNSGASIAAQRSNAQAAAQSAAMSGQQAAAAANANRMAALQGYGQMASGIRGQDYSQDAARAQANDAFAQFNAANAQAVQARNADRNQAAQQATFNNGYTQSGGLAGMADRRRQQARDTQQFFTGQGQAVGGMFGGGLDVAASAAGKGGF